MEYKNHPEVKQVVDEIIVTIRMKSAPMCFWSYLSPKEWQSLDIDYQNRLIEAAKKIYK